MDEFLKQTELARTLVENKKTDSPNGSSSKNISYTECETVPYRA